MNKKLNKAELKEFSIWGKITLELDFDVEATSKEEALKKAKSELEDFYHLRVTNAPHDHEDVKYDIDASEIEYEN